MNKDEFDRFLRLKDKFKYFLSEERTYMFKGEIDLTVRAGDS